MQNGNYINICRPTFRLQPYLNEKLKGVTASNLLKRTSFQFSITLRTVKTVKTWLFTYSGDEGHHRSSVAMV